jgi:hypothetical protein
MTDPSGLDLSRWAPSLAPFADWLVARDRAAAENWETRINQTDHAAVEGAVAEAVAWDYLDKRVSRIEPGSPITTTGRRPDFECWSEAGDRFAVEVTNLSRAVVSEATHLQDPAVVGGGMRSYGDWGHLVKRELSSKTAQGAGLDCPYVVFVTTLHIEASVLLCSKPHVEPLLHSPVQITMHMNENMEAVGGIYNSTDFRHAAFTATGTINPERRNVSVLLVGGFGTYRNVRVLGVEHQEALRPLPRTDLPDIPRCFFVIWPPDPRVIVGWTDEEPIVPPPPPPPRSRLILP